METATKKSTKRKSMRSANSLKNTKNLRSNNRKEFVLSKKDHADFIRIKATKTRNYQEESPLYFFIGLIIALLMLITAFNWKTYDQRMISLNDLEAESFDDIQEIPLTEQPPPPPPVVQLPTIIAVADQVLIEEIEVNLDVEITEDMAIEDLEFVPDDIEEEEAEEIFQIVEVKPEPYGGFEAFYKYVGENIKYPNLARRMRIEGRVFLKFVIDKDGSIIMSEVLKGIGGGCDKEALRVVQNAPKWIPGKQRGKPVKVYVMLPITFRLDG